MWPEPTDEKDGYDGRWIPGCETNWAYQDGVKKREQHEREAAEMRDRWSTPSSSTSNGGSSFSSSGGGGCFTGQTNVMTPNGTKPICDIKKGDKVLSWDSDNQDLVERTVLKVVHHASKPITQVTFDIEVASLETTMAHTFSTNEGWKKLAKMTGHESMTAISNSKSFLAPIAAIIQTGRKEPVFNLITEGEHNFIAGGVVAHNFTFLRNIRSALHSAAETAVKPMQKFYPSFAFSGLAK